MNFSTQIPRAIQPRFAEGTGLASVRDSRNNSQLWKKSKDSVKQQNGYGNAIQNLARDIQRLRKRQVGYMASENLSHPFKIYQPSNVSQFASGVTFLNGTTATRVTCAISSLVPTTPQPWNAIDPITVNPITDGWRFWVVRTGLLDYRPIYSLSNPPDFSNDNYHGIFPSENFVWKFPVGTDGVMPVTGHDFDDPTTAAWPDSRTTILIIPGTISVTNATFFSLWISITPETILAAPAFSVVGALFNVNNPSESSLFGFPSPLKIPIGQINFTLSESSILVSQYLFDHVRGRYPAPLGNYLNGTSQFNSGSVFNFRGVCDADNAIYTPADLDKQVFYPGDVVRTSYNGATGLYQFAGVQFNGTNYPAVGGTFSSSPPPFNPATATHWFQVS